MTSLAPIDAPPATVDPIATYPSAESPPLMPPQLIIIPQQPESQGPVKRIIVIGCDETEAAKRSIDWCLDNIASQGDKLILMRIVPFTSVYPSSYAPSFGMIPPPMFAEDAMEELRIQKNIEDQVEGRMISDLIPAIEEKKIEYEIDALTIASGVDWEVNSIAQAICQRAEEVKASLIVVSKHNKGMLKELFTGSVTSKVIHNSKIPVLVFHGDGTAA